MLKRILFSILVTLLVACSEPKPEFESYGLFVQTSNGYEEAKPSNPRQKNLKGLIKPEINEKKVTIYVHDPKFDADNVAIVQMGMDLNKGDKVEFSVVPQEKANLYKLALKIKDRSMPLLMLRSGGIFSAKGYIFAVGDVEASAVAALKNMKGSSYKKLKQVKEFLDSFPENKALQLKLKELEEKAAEEQVAARERQQKQYEKMAYEEAKKSEKNFRDKEKWIESYQLFLTRYPLSGYQDAAKQRIETIQKGIDDSKKEYEEQLSKFENIVGQFVTAIKNKNQEKLGSVTVKKSSASRAFQTSRLVKANLTDIQVEKFHYSNIKTRNSAYVALKGTALKRVDMKLIEGEWLISSYSI